MSITEQGTRRRADRDVLPDEVAEVLQRRYDTGEWLEWRRTPKGHANTTFFVDAASGRYALRRSNSRKSINSLKFEVRLLEYLVGRGYPAPEIVRDRSGEAYVEVGGTFYLLTRFLAGGPYDRENREHLLEVGRGLGRYHRLVRDYPDPYYSRPAPLLTEPEPMGIVAMAQAATLAGGFLSAEEQELLEESFSIVREQFGVVHQELAEVYPELPTLIIQGSFGRSALIFDADRLVGVVDYDRAAMEVRALDLAYTVKSFCREDKADGEVWVGLDEARFADFMSAYQEEERLPRGELLALPLVFRAQHLAKTFTKCENFVRKNEIVPQEAKDVMKLAETAHREAARLRWLEQHGPELVGRIAS